MFQNIHRKRILKHKMNDISLHIKEILDDRKEKKSRKIRERFSRFKTRRTKNFDK